MATYDTRLGSNHGEARVARPLHLSWSSLWGGSLLGWATLFTLSLVGASIGLAKVEADSSASYVGDRLGSIGVGVGIWGLVAMVIAAFIGGYFVVRIAGERRRREGLLHAAVAWGLSAMALAIIAFSALNTAAASTDQTATKSAAAVAHRARARENTRGDASPSKLTPREQVAIEDSSQNAAKAAGATAGALGLSLVFSLFGGLVACAIVSGRKLGDELQLKRRDHALVGAGRGTERELMASPRNPRERDDFNQPTILPPTH